MLSVRVPNPNGESLTTNQDRERGIFRYHLAGRDYAWDALLLSVDLSKYFEENPIESDTFTNYSKLRPLIDAVRQSIGVPRIENDPENGWSDSDILLFCQHFTYEFSFQVEKEPENLNDCGCGE